MYHAILTYLGYEHPEWQLNPGTPATGTADVGTVIEVLALLLQETDKWADATVPEFVRYYLLATPGPHSIDGFAKWVDAEWGPFSERNNP